MHCGLIFYEPEFDVQGAMSYVCVVHQITLGMRLRCVLCKVSTL